MKKLFFVAFMMTTSFLLMAQTKTALRLDKLDIDSMKNLVTKSSFNGTILIYSGKNLAINMHKGYSNIEKKNLNNINTRFNIGSIGKSLTAILIMQLVEKKLINLDFPANHYLPSKYQLRFNKLVTIRQLLNMTSSLGDYFDSPYYSDTIATTNGLMNLVLEMKPENNSLGVKFSYSNSAFIVLGKILENLYNKNYRQIINENILEPAGIYLTNKKEVATGYSLQDTILIVGKDNNPNVWSAAGGLYLTISEMHSIIRSLIEGKYLTKESINRMWTIESHPENDPPFSNYGLGWMVESPGGVELRGHNGGVRGFQSVVRYLPNENIYIYVFSNYEKGAEEIFMKELFFLLGKKGIHFN